MNGGSEASKSNAADLKNIQIEYVSMDENILAPGRVRLACLDKIGLQHVAEFRHVFEHFTTPMNELSSKKKEDEKRGHDSSKDAFTKTTEL